MVLLGTDGETIAICMRTLALTDLEMNVVTNTGRRGPFGKFLKLHNGDGV